MLQTLTFNGARVINAEASFFRYESGSAGGADESIKLRADGQDLGMYYPGDSVELPDRRAMWEITPTTAACAGTVRLGVGRVQSARLVGNVRVIDSGVDKTRAGNQFMSTTGLNAVAGVFSVGTVYPTNKTVAIKRIAIAGSASGTVYIGTATGAPTVNQLLQPGMRNKQVGGAVSDLQRALGTCAAQPPTTVEVPGYLGWFTMPIAANVFTELPLTTPIVLAPGQHLVFVGPAINASVSALMDWEEMT